MDVTRAAPLFCSTQPAMSSTAPAMSSTGFPATLPMPVTAPTTPNRIAHQANSSNRALLNSPLLNFSLTLTIMPVKICTMPSASEPNRMAMVSSSGVNSAGMVKVLSGSKIMMACGMKSPKKPPVAAPHRKVEMPHQTSSSPKSLVPPLAFIFFIMSMPAANIRMP